jgi:TonB-dependent SusC/RagA subfamily outer membrane receptor
MKKPERLLAILLLILLYAPAQSQTAISILDSLSSGLLATNSRQPSIYVHLDKPVQPAGSSVWFKVYLYQRSTHLPFTSGLNVYADLIDKAGAVVDRLVLESSDLRLEGNFQLPRELPGGTYYLRVYTSDIIRKNPEHIYITPLYVYNPSAPGNWTSAAACMAYYGKARQTKPGIQFFPEGNQLVNGIDNVVAIQAFDTNGKPISGTGIVKDNRDSIVTQFTINTTGLGQFIISPVKSRKYRAIINQQEYPLPDVPVSAYQLALVKQDATNFTFRVALSDLLYTRSPSSYVIGMSNGRVSFTAAGKGMYLVTVPKNKFSAGIAEFYLYGEDRKLASTRKIFVDKNDVRVTIEADKKQYMRRATVKLSMSVTDSAGNGLPALLSVSVTDNNTVAADLLPGFREHIWKQGLGLHPNDPGASTANRDLLALVYSKPAQVDPDTASGTPAGLTMAGRLVNSKNTAVSKQPFSIFSEQEKSIVLNDTTDENGRFSISPVRFYDSTQFMLYADVPVSDWRLQTYEDTFATDNFPSLMQDCYTDPEFSSGLSKFERSGADTFLIGNTKGWLQDVLVKSRRKKAQPGAEQKRNSFTRIITREQLSKLNLSNTANAVKMVPGVIMINDKLTIRGGVPVLSPGLDANLEPLVIVDGVQANPGNSVVNYLNSIPPETIEYIEVMTGPEAAQYGSRAANGVIFIKTGLPVLNTKKTENVLTFYPRGYHLAPAFYQPDYSADAVYSATFNDNRSTIYWNGNLMTDEKGKLNLQFYTADPKTTYTVTVIGITSKGEIIQQQITLSRE